MRILILALVVLVSSCGSVKQKLRKNCAVVGQLPDTQETLSVCDEL